MRQTEAELPAKTHAELLRRKLNSDDWLFSRITCALIYMLRGWVTIALVQLPRHQHGE